MESLPFSALLAVLSITLCDSAIPIFFPSEPQLEWKPVLPGSRYCPQSNEMSLDPDLKKSTISVKVPIGVTPSKSDGYLCHGAKWVSTCDFRWYGPKYITHSIHNLRPTTNDCEDAIKKYEAGTLINPGFPPDSCAYATVTDSEHLVILITPHHVGVDDYRGAWVDDSFPSGVCETNQCDTTHNSSIWIPKTKTRHNICSQTFANLSVTISYREGGAMKGADMVFHSKYHPHMVGGHICKMNFCNKQGLRLQNEEWIEIPSGTKVGNQDLMNLFSDCKSGLEVRSTLRSEGANTLTWETQRLLDYALCQNTWDKFDNQGAVSALDLSYLAARAPGKGVAYTMINGTLHSAPTRYVRMWIESPSMEELKAKKESSSGVETSIWNQWFPFKGGEIGPNGLIKAGNKYKFPLYLVGMGMLDDEINALELGGPIDHPQRAHAQAVLGDEETLFFGDTGVGKNPVELITGWFSGWKETIMAVVAIFLLVIVLYGVLRCCPTICVLCKRKSRHRTKDMEMQYIPNNQRHWR
ncbi:glycoprotein [Vesiculovirus jurona]|uniref:Glycoprotein n=1 Tax=Vesiculovirus jurona TaxID=1972568 RepID=I1SV84_9RHAB|nr:glycoprotein [Vesiculovirus jurona]AEG25348.1 glycoprotein [Vesiculovirus jurona]AJR28384.1 glycoprotein [Vesiculovirus jurona]